MAHDLIKKKIIYVRPGTPTYTSIPVEFPVGIGEAVSLFAIHWHIEQVHNQFSPAIIIAALSENPEHELAPPVGIAEMHGNLSLYGMATFVSAISLNGTDGAQSMIYGTQIIPLYGILRPKRQIAVFANVWATGFTGIRGEIYYEEEQPRRPILDAISRRYGKYRRS